MKNLLRGEKGIRLLSVLIAMALLSLVGVAALYALGTAYKALSLADKRATAESLARSEMEYIKALPYSELPDSWSYDIPGSPPSWDPGHNSLGGHDNYSALVSGEHFDVNGNSTIDENEEDIQIITITIEHLGEVVITLEDYKVNR